MITVLRFNLNLDQVDKNVIRVNVSNELNEVKRISLRNDSTYEIVSKRFLVSPQPL